jgi:hypothetical protein
MGGTPVSAGNTLTTLNKVIIKCTVHYIVHLQSTFSLSRMYESKGFWRFSLILNPQDTIQQWKNTVPVPYSNMYSFKGWQNNKNQVLPSKRCISNEKSVIVTHFTMKIIRTYPHITCNKKILLKKYLSLLWVFTDFFILLVAF